MSNFEAFMIENTTEEIEYVVSNRFKDKAGKVIPFKLKCINSKENNDIRKDCYTKVAIPGKRGQYTKEFDVAKYTTNLILACVVSPNLNDKDLQDYYNVMGAEAVLGKMLKPSEYDDLAAKVQEINGYNSLEEDIEEAKN